MMEGQHMLSPVYELADGDMSFFNEILDSMETNIPHDIAEIEAAIKEKHLTLVCRSAHHMKSSIMYSNAEELKELLTTIENTKDSSLFQKIEAMMPRLKTLAKELLDIISIEKKIKQ